MALCELRLDGRPLADGEGGDVSGKKQPAIDVGMIVELHLVRLGLDGLSNENGGCACKLGAISPDDCLDSLCVPGWFQKCPHGTEGCQTLHIGRDRAARI